MSIEKPLLRLAHISDLHFYKLTWNPSQFFCKRWLGNLNLALARKHAFDPSGLTSLIPIFQQKGVENIIITGDLTSTSHEKEFLLAQKFIHTLQQEGFKVFVLPGNHDHYTRKAYKDRLFYRFFDSTYPSESTGLPLSLEEDGIATSYFGNRWWLFALDTALATSLLSSNGFFSSDLEKKLEKALNNTPHDHNVILVNHFPLFANESLRKSLLRREALKKILERFPKIKLFLHGHTHRHCIADLQKSHLPIIADSGSTGQKREATWNLIDITPQGCEIEVFKNHRDVYNISWNSMQRHHFKWEPR